MDFTEIVLGVFTLINTLALGYVAFKRGSFQNTVDDSTASINYRHLVIDLQKELAEVKTLVNKSHLEVSMSIRMGEQPQVVSWRWLRKEDDPVIVSSPE